MLLVGGQSFVTSKPVGEPRDVNPAAEVKTRLFLPLAVASASCPLSRPKDPRNWNSVRAYRSASMGAALI